MSNLICKANQYLAEKKMLIMLRHSIDDRALLLNNTYALYLVNSMALPKFGTFYNTLDLGKIVKVNLLQSIAVQHHVLHFKFT